MSYWVWLIRGTGGRPGIRRFLDWWLIVHAIVAVGLSVVVPVPLQEAAAVFLLPLAGILIGLSFAWAGNAQTLLQTQEIEYFAEHHPGGFAEYVYVYQTAVLLILTTLVLWGLAGAQVFDKTWPTPALPKAYMLVEVVLFGLASVAIRECWHVVLGAQCMLLVRRNIRKKQRDSAN